MFNLIIRYLGFLKFVPGLAHLFDAMLRMQTVLINPALLDYIDEIEAEVLSWNNISTKTHKYGGLQFNYGEAELGHIHSNGLLDMLFSRKLKEQLTTLDKRVKEHHTLKNTGWISLYMWTESDKEFAIELFAMAYHRYADKELNTLNIT